MSVLGVDLRASNKKPSPVAVLDPDFQLTQLVSFYEDIALAALVKQERPALVAIGAPLNLPSGLCCLDKSCECRFSFSDRKGRLLELEMAKIGISCFYTNKRSITRDLIYRGIRLNHELRSAGYNVIEVYPHATKTLLFGEKMPPKHSRTSVSYMIAHLTPLVSGMEQFAHDLDRNACDAIINAYTGRLHFNSGTDALGDPDEGVLVLPKLCS